MSRFAIQQLRFNNTLYPGISGWQVNPGIEVNSDQLDGTVHETAHHEMAHAPVAELTTRDLGFLSVLNDNTDYWVKACDGTNGIECIGAKASTSGPGYQGGSVHALRKMARGFLFGLGIGWSKKGKAELSLRGMGTSADGTAAALSSTTVALPTAPVPDFGWILSSLTINADAITKVDTCNVSVDPRAEFDWLYGLPQPTDVLQAGVNGPAMWRLAATGGNLDLGVGTGAVSAVYRRLAIGGGFSAAANSTLTVTFNANYSVSEGDGGQAGQAMTRQLQVRPRQNGTTKPVTWAFS